MGLFLMALRAVRFGRLAEGFGTVMAYPTGLVCTVLCLGQFQVFFFHLEDFRMTIRAFQFVRGRVGFVAESDGSRAPFGFKLDITSSDFLLRVGQAKGHNA